MYVIATIPASLTTMASDIASFLTTVQDYQVTVLVFSVVIGLAWRFKRKS